MALKAVLSNILFKIPSNVICKRTLLKSAQQNGKALSYAKAKINEESKFMSIQEEMLSLAIKNFNQNPTEWTTLKKTILENGRTVNCINFDAKIIGFCINHRNIDAARSYIDFIYSNNQKPNVATLGKYLRLHFLCCNEKRAKKDQEDSILKIYEDLKNICPMFDSITAENVILGISLTSKWKDSLDILEGLKLTSKPGGGTYSAIATAAFLNNESKIGWKMLDEALLNDRLPHPTVYISYLKMAAQNKMTLVEKAEELLTFFSNNDIQPSKDVTDEIIKSLKIFGYSGGYSTIGKKGYCQSCYNSLHQVTLDKADFDKMKLVFFNNVIIGRNVFNKTTPEELNKFIDFMTRTEPYDMVIDGLNVAYAAGNKSSPHAYAKMVASVVDHFTQISANRILVLGRVHMDKWPKDQMDYIRSKADVFLTQNISQDDPYLLYATMASGLGTGFLSRDFMRGHSYLLMDSNIRRIFRRWQQLHQHSLMFVEKNGKVHIKHPYNNLPTVQKHRSGWHIPYTQEFLANPPASLDPPKNWLCLHKPN